jgi:hypothetical protein
MEVINVSFTITTDNEEKKNLIMNKVLELLLDKENPEIYIEISKKNTEYEKI